MTIPAAVSKATRLVAQDAQITAWLAVVAMVLVLQNLFWRERRGTLSHAFRLIEPKADRKSHTEAILGNVHMQLAATVWQEQL